MNKDMSRVHRLGNGVTTNTFDLLFGTSIGDVCSDMYLLRRGRRMIYNWRSIC